MSLKRRNFIALILILLSALAFAFGQKILGIYIGSGGGYPEFSSTLESGSFGAVTDGDIEGSTHSTATSSTEMTFGDIGSELDSSSGDENTEGVLVKRVQGMLLMIYAALHAVIAIAVLYQKNPICGPDGGCILFSVSAAVYALADPVWQTWELAIAAFAFLWSIREAVGWMRARLSLSWCLVHRITKRCRAPQISLMVFIAWIFIPLIGLACLHGRSVRYPEILGVVFGCLAALVFGILCLWKYGADLQHFKRQLDRYQQGETIVVGNGAFAGTEKQLLEIQAQHEEAVRTAVVSERFKVELISNVSHDLRTPLTSILGYSELLQKEALSPTGKEQLGRLYEKAGYMNDLVESLFELTKVSSGVVESKKDSIDLVRLLEQTVGLFDDRLTDVGLSVRRSYCADAIPMITDGARMHRVFANLLGNAIKYALAGTRIYLDVKETESSYRVRMVNTASYEMDFKPDEIVRRFARGDKARSTSGSGLGLAIAQTYTESVGGVFYVLVDGDQFSAVVELPKTERNL